jgi:hypothetical protein
MGQNSLLERDPRVSVIQINPIQVSDGQENQVDVVIEWRISEPEIFSDTISTCEKWTQLNEFQLNTFVKTKNEVLGLHDLQLTTILQLWFDEYYDYYRENFGVCLINIYPNYNQDIIK